MFHLDFPGNATRYDLHLPGNARRWHCAQVRPRAPGVTQGAGYCFRFAPSKLRPMGRFDIADTMSEGVGQSWVSSMPTLLFINKLVIDITTTWAKTLTWHHG